MAYYKALQGLKGVQIDYNRFQFSWSSAGNDYQAHFLWIYKEDELEIPQVCKYAQCIDNRVQATFQYNNVSLKEIKNIKFLIFLSDEQAAPPENEIYHMSQRPEFLCNVCCGTAYVRWQWLSEKTGMRLVINSDKRIPEGILYYEYFYGNKLFCFDIPGEISCGNNYYGNIYFPEIPGIPQLKSRESNLTVDAQNGKIIEGASSGGLLKKFINMVRH